MGNSGEAGGADHVGERVGAGILADGFDQIAVGLGVAGDGTPELRDHVEGEHVVEPVEPGYFDAGKLKAQEAATMLEHAMGLSESEINPRHYADAEGDPKSVVCLV